MKYLISGGGTGGHIYPALAIAREIEKTDKDAKILYVGTKDSLESELVPKEGFDFKTIRVNYLPRKINKKFFIAIKELFLGLKDSNNILKEFKPDIVIGTGGYVSGPIVFKANRKKIKTIIHEQNAYPGITNKILSRYVDRIAVTFDGAIKYFKHPQRVINTGNPIREEITNIDKDKARNKLNIDKNKPFILSFGGSGGQWKLNQAILNGIEKEYIDDNIQITHITGKKLYRDFQIALDEKNIKLKKNIKIFPYLYEMPEALNIADIVITSSGAITLSEISAIGVPSILIPKAYTAENHQEYNARDFEKKGASVVILEKELDGEVLFEKIDEILNDKEKLRNMSKNSKKIGKLNASSEIMELIRQLTL